MLLLFPMQNAVFAKKKKIKIYVYFDVQHMQHVHWHMHVITAYRIFIYDINY